MNRDIIDNYDFEWDCACCHAEALKIKENINGECPHCKSKYKWDFDCNHEDAVYIPIFECSPDFYQ